MITSELYEHPHGRQTRWFSFENPNGEKGAAAKAHRGRKGAACRGIAPGERVTLLKTDGTGVIRMIWATYLRYQDPERIRKLRIEMYWDGATTPAVNAPFDDFFCQAADPEKKPFENALFSSAEGRNYTSIVPMPFKKSAEIVVVNDGDDNVEQFYYIIEASFGDPLPEDMLYFHAIYSPERKTVMRQDYEILPKINGCGRYLGCNINVRTDPCYKGTWWGEGEVKIYMDGDNEYPTLVGTGTEDYIMTAWGQGVFSNQESGCLLAREDENGESKISFYRLHISDPVWFYEDCRVTIQQIGSSGADDLRRVSETDAIMEPIYALTSVDLVDNNIRWFDEFSLDDPKLLFTGFEREDWYSSIAYFYLDRPAP